MILKGLWFSGETHNTVASVQSVYTRSQVFQESSIPVVSHYESLGKVRRIIADKPVDEVYEVTKDCFEAYAKVPVAA